MTRLRVRVHGVLAKRRKDKAPVSKIQQPISNVEVKRALRDLSGTVFDPGSPIAAGSCMMGASMSNRVSEEPIPRLRRRGSLTPPKRLTEGLLNGFGTGFLKYARALEEYES